MHARPSLRHRPVLLAAAFLAALSMASCASAPARAPGQDSDFRSLNGDQDFMRLNLDRTEVAVWEDGRRSAQGGDSYEWWYFDGMLDDGTVIVAWIGDNWPWGSHKRAVNLEVTLPDGTTRAFQKLFAEAGSWSRERADARVGPHSFSGDLETYRIVVDPSDSVAASGGHASGGDASGEPTDGPDRGLGLDITLRRTVASWRPGTGIVASDDRSFAWLVAVPNGEFTGTLTLDGQTREIRGSGYHDHNWGNVSPALLMRSWWWGRAVVGDRTIIVSRLDATKARGGASYPLVFVGSPRGVEVSAYEPDSVTVAEGPAVRHPDPKHPRPIGGSVTFTTTEGVTTRFAVSDRWIASVDLAATQGWGLHALATVAGLRPWYSRFYGPVTLSFPGEVEESGMGTLEYFEFR